MKKKMCKITQEAEQRNLCKHSLILCDREVNFGLVDLLLPDKPRIFRANLCTFQEGQLFFCYYETHLGERNRVEINIDRISL